MSSPITKRRYGESSGHCRSRFVQLPEEERISSRGRRGKGNFDEHRLVLQLYRELGLVDPVALASSLLVPLSGAPVQSGARGIVKVERDDYVGKEVRDGLHELGKAFRDGWTPTYGVKECDKVGQRAILSTLGCSKRGECGPSPTVMTPSLMVMSP